MLQTPRPPVILEEGTTNLQLPHPPTFEESIPNTSKEERISDKQFNAIIEMAIQILSRAKDLDDAKSALTAIKRG